MSTAEKFPDMSDIIQVKESRVGRAEENTFNPIRPGLFWSSWAWEGGGGGFKSPPP